MSWLLSLPYIGKALGWLAEAGMAVLRWIFADFRHIAITGLAVLALVFWLRMGALHETAQAETARADAATARAFAMRERHRQFAFRVLATQEAARRAAAANVARVEAEFATINERVTYDYEDRLAGTDAALARLRHQLDLAGAAGTNRGSGGGAAVPDAHAATCRAFGAADCDALFATLPNTLAHAELNTAKLIGLQEYVRGSLLVDFSGSDAIAPVEAGEPVD